MAKVFKFDGIDGCGKTTLIEGLFWTLSGSKCHLVKEFGDELDQTMDGIAVFNFFRKVAKSNSIDLDEIERELIWTILSRRTNRKVIPNTSSNYDIILVDRSNVLGNHAPGALIDSKLNSLYGFLVDRIENFDKVFWINTPPEVCYSRIKLREQSKADFVESKDLDYFYELSFQYEKIARSNKKIVELDGNLSIEELISIVLPIVQN